jgi:hypothetical protein
MKLKSLLIVGASSLFLASCLKSKDSLGLISDKGSIVSEIADVNIDGPIKIITLEGTPPTETFTLITLKSYAARDNKPAGDKVHVKLALNNSALPSGMTALPANAYTLPALEFDVPTGGSIAIPITLNKSLLDLSLSYGIALKITEVSAGVPSDLAKSIVVNLLVKNRFDGKYTMTGTLQDFAVTTIVALSPWNVELVTTGSNSVYLHNSGTATPSFADLFPISNGGTESGYGSFTPEFQFDANNNVVAVVNAYGQPASNTRSAAIDPSGINKWDPVTKTLKVKWFMYQPSAIAGIRAKFDFTFTYTGPR